jgi:hypothetical protein
MASGSYAKRPQPQEPLDVTTHIPPRATRRLTETLIEEQETNTGLYFPRSTVSRTVEVSGEKKAARKNGNLNTVKARKKSVIVVDEFKPALQKHRRPWLNALVICMVGVVMFIGVLLSSSMWQRPGSSTIGYNYQGGAVNVVKDGNVSWLTPAPAPSKVPIPTQTGPYSVLGKPSLTVDFMNRVLDSYNSPARGKAQALYDLGLKYEIDPAYALAFFQHESSFGNAGMARETKSLGNLRCYNGAPACVAQDRGGYASYPSWESGFEAWYQLIRNYYVAVRGLVTVDKIIPVYAPQADNNNEQGYIAALKHAIDTWHAGQLRP